MQVHLVDQPERRAEAADQLGAAVGADHDRPRVPGQTRSTVSADRPPETARPSSAAASVQNCCGWAAWSMTSSSISSACTGGRPSRTSARSTSRTGRGPSRPRRRGRFPGTPARAASRWLPLNGARPRRGTDGPAVPAAAPPALRRGRTRPARQPSQRATKSAKRSAGRASEPRPVDQPCHPEIEECAHEHAPDAVHEGSRPDGPPHPRFDRPGGYAVEQGSRLGPAGPGVGGGTGAS